MAAPVRTVISPSRYVQGKGSIHQLGEYLKPIGSTPLLVADDLVWGLVGHDVEASLKNAGLPVQRETFRGVPSAKEVDRLVDAIKASGADVAVAIGGGSTIDAVKAAGFLADIRWANCPTVASTDAPCSALSVIYTEDGEFEEYRFFPRNPDLVLVDSQVVANAPVDLLVAGVGDALATWLEARATAQSNSNTMAGGLPTLTGTALAKLSWDVLWDNALQAVDAVTRPPGHARARQGDRGEHPALRPRVRVGRARRRARDPQRAHRRRGHARARARSEGEHRLGHPARPRGCADAATSATSSSSPPESGCRTR